MTVTKYWSSNHYRDSILKAFQKRFDGHWNHVFELCASTGGQNFESLKESLFLTRRFLSFSTQCNRSKQVFFCKVKKSATFKSYLRNYRYSSGSTSRVITGSGGTRNFKSAFQWRIQDFPEEAPTLKVDVLTYYFVLFCRKLHKNERIWTLGGTRPWSPIFL